MSTKFEQLLDYIVNEEMDKANELFHEIVVEKSREIYENLIAEEEDQTEVDEQIDDEQEETAESMEQETDEGYESQEETEESMHQDTELEDSYEMDSDDIEEDDFDTEPTMDKTDDFLGDIESEGGDAVDEIKNAIKELEDALKDLGASPDSDDMGDMDMDMDADMDDEDDKENEMMGMVREYRETVAKPSGDVAGANTGEKMSAPSATKSPISSGSGKPTSGAKAIQAKAEHANEDGTKPHGKVGGLTKQGGKFVGNNTLNVDNAQTGVKKLSKVSKPADAEGHAVGAGTGDNSVKGSTNTTSPLKHVK